MMKGIDSERLRISFVVYGGMNRKDWRTISIADVNFDPDELARLLIPTLNRRFMKNQGSPTEYGERLVRECQLMLETVLPLNDPEREFLDLVGKGIDASALTPDKALQKRIQSQPLLQWKALNVKRQKDWNEKVLRPRDKGPSMGRNRQWPYTCFTKPQITHTLLQSRHRRDSPRNSEKRRIGEFRVRLRLRRRISG